MRPGASSDPPMPGCRITAGRGLVLGCDDRPDRPLWSRRVC